MYRKKNSQKKDCKKCRKKKDVEREKARNRRGKRIREITASKRKAPEKEKLALEMSLAQKGPSQLQ